MFSWFKRSAGKEHRTPLEFWTEDRPVEVTESKFKLESDARGKPFAVVAWSGGDEGLDRLQQTANLRWLDLSRTNITDAGLVHLRPLRSLEVLKLHQTRVTDAGGNISFFIPAGATGVVDTFIVTVVGGPSATTTHKW